MSKLVSTNPADNYSIVGEVEISTDSEITKKIKKAQDAKKSWRQLGVKKRTQQLKPILAKIEERQDEVAKLITQEMGKPISQSYSEIGSVTRGFNWFLDNVEEAIKPEITFEDKNSLHKIVYEPHGVACVITPWNYPLNMAIWGIVPNLLVGNTIIFKTSEENPLVGKFIEEIFAGLPDGVFNEVYGDGEVGAKMSEGEVDLIWFTGSSQVGKLLYKTAANKFIKAILEMGGSNPCLVFEDANIVEAAQLIYEGRFDNCGQSCDALKRLIVHKSVAKKLIEELSKILLSKKMGDTMSEETEIGSLVAKRQQVLLSSQVDDALKKGAKILAQLELPASLKGAFYPPTILGSVKKDMRVWTEEVFGPVLSMITFETEDEAIELANDTSYGLGSRVITKDKKRAERVASEIEAGTVEINKGDRWLKCNPFGGVKGSGMGREHGTIGFQELCQIKVISTSKS